MSSVYLGVIHNTEKKCLMAALISVSLVSVPLGALCKLMGYYSIKFIAIFSIESPICAFH